MNTPKTPKRGYFGGNFNVHVNNTPHEDIDKYMKDVLSKAYSGREYTEPQFKRALDVYNILLSRESSFDLNVMDIIFDGMLQKQGINFKHIVIIDGDVMLDDSLNDNLVKIKNAVVSNRDKRKCYFIKMSIRFEHSGHRNLLMIDASKGLPANIYRIEPHGENSFKVNPNIILGRKINHTKDFIFLGELYNHVPCKRLVGLQARLGGGYCVTYSVFLAYMLLRSPRYGPEYFVRLGNKNINKNTNLYKVENLWIGGQRYVFGKFMEKVFRIYYKSLKNLYGNTMRTPISRYTNASILNRNRFSVDIGNFIKAYINHENLLPTPTKKQVKDYWTASNC